MDVKLTPQCPSLSLHAETVSWMYQSGNKDENCENKIINRGNNTVLTQKVVKITKIHTFMAKHDHFVLDEFFATFFACNEAHKKRKIQ